MIKQFDTEKVEQFLNSFYPTWVEFTIRLVDGEITGYEVIHRNRFDGTFIITLLGPCELGILDLDLIPENKHGIKMITIHS